VKGVDDALSRRSGVREVSVRLQDGIVIVVTDPTKPVLPSALWNDIERVGFVPATMDVWVTGSTDGHAVVLDGARWPVVGAEPADARVRSLHVRVLAGDEDPPRVEIVGERPDAAR